LRQNQRLSIFRIAPLLKAPLLISYLRCCDYIIFYILVRLCKRQYFSIAKYFRTVKNSDYAWSQPTCYIFEHGRSYPWSFGFWSRWPRYTRNPRGDSTEGTYTILHFVRSLSSCPWGFVFLVTRLIPQKHVTDSSLLEIEGWFLNYRSPKCLEIYVYMHINVSKHRLYLYFAINKKLIFYLQIFHIHPISW